MARLIRFDCLRPMPWKNGGGSTVELFVWPPAAGMADFDCRISLATIAQDGPFSRFPGIDRTLALVDGAGVTLSIDGGAAQPVDAAHPLIAFAGERAIEARVNHGVTTDFNVMTRRRRCRHRFTALDGAQTVAAKDGFALLFAAGAAVAVAGANDHYQLARYDTLVLDAHEQVTLDGAAARVFLVEIEALP